MAKARPISEEEFRRVLAAVNGSRKPHRNRLCLLLSCRAGMRVGEIQSLDVADVYEEATCAVRKAIYLDAARTKWGHARSVFLNRTVQTAVTAHLQDRGLTSGPLITNQHHERFSRTGLVNLFRLLYRRAGLHTSSHAGRRLFIHSLADRGVSIRIIQEAVGHRSLQATNTYLSARPAEIAAAVELIR